RLDPPAGQALAATASLDLRERAAWNHPLLVAGESRHHAAGNVRRGVWRADAAALVAATPAASRPDASATSRGLKTQRRRALRTLLRGFGAGFGRLGIRLRRFGLRLRRFRHLLRCGLGRGLQLELVAF